MSDSANKYEEAVLILADITGYTRFLTLHALSKYHAEELIAELVEELIEVAGKALTLSKIEGDAVFFYLPLSDRKEDVAALLSRQFIAFFQAFTRKRGELNARRICICDACANVQELTLKVVGHVGGIYMREIKGFRELAGPDVVLAHRLLKNNLPKRPYVLKTKPLYELIGPAWGFKTQKLIESYPDFDDVETYVTYLDAALPGSSDDPPSASAYQKLRQFAGLCWRALLSRLGLRRRRAALA